MDVEATLDRALQLGEEGEWAEMAQLLENALEDERFAVPAAGVDRRPAIVLEQPLSKPVVIRYTPSGGLRVRRAAVR